MDGPPLYQLSHGNMCMTEPHKPYAIGSRERDQWLGAHRRQRRSQSDIAKPDGVRCQCRAQSQQQRDRTRNYTSRRLIQRGICG
jgi:hypothetical protein